MLWAQPRARAADSFLQHLVVIRSNLPARPRRRRLGVVGVAAVFAPAVACHHRGEAALAASLNEPTAAAAERAAAVGVAVGDRVRVKVWREPTYSDSLVVDSRGEVVLPRVGPMTVAGLTIGSLQDSLRARYSVYLRDPIVTVTVLRRVGVQGEVRMPGLYYVDATMTLRDVIAQSGGLTDAADAGDVELVRDGRRTELDTRTTNGQSALTELRSGDAVVVGRTSWLSRNALAVASTIGLVVSVGVQVFRR